MADQNDINNQIVIGSVQSCCRRNRLEQLRRQDFDVLMFDEAHHVLADSYQTIISDLGFRKGSSLLLLGVTPTPMRSDNQGLGATFDKITFSRTIGTMIKDANYMTQHLHSTSLSR